MQLLHFGNFFQNSTGKTCGSWHRLPRRYRRQLRRDEIHAQLTNQDGVTISGRIGKHYGLSSELFSGLATSTTGHTFTFIFKANSDRLFRPLLCISTSFRVLRASHSWLKHFFGRLTYFVHFKWFSVIFWLKLRKNKKKLLKTFEMNKKGRKPPKKVFRPAF